MSDAINQHQAEAKRIKNSQQFFICDGMNFRVRVSTQRNQTLNAKEKDQTMPFSDFTDRLIRDTEGAAIMGWSKATWWRRVADGTIPPAIKIGGTSRWRLSDIEAVIAKAEAER